MKRSFAGCCIGLSFLFKAVFFVTASSALLVVATNAADCYAPTPGYSCPQQVTQFMVLTAKIPRYQQRLDCALFMKAFDGDANFLSEKLQLVDTARTEVVQSTRLKRLIEVVLAYGNYLNEGTRNGEARGIKLSSLLKLDTVK